jgi:uncharacterized membrane protein YjjP (DUF1212 family)
LGVIHGVFDAASLLLIAFSAGTGALVRRWLATLGGNPFIQPLCAAAVAGAIGAIATRLRLPDTQLFVTLCPCMLLIPGPHILNGAFGGEPAPVDLIPSVAANGTTAFLIILAMSFGLIVPRMLCGYFRTLSARHRSDHA